jgi:hypothetical protein
VTQNKKLRKGSIAYEVGRIAWAAAPIMALADEAVERGMTIQELVTLLRAAYRGAQR